MVLKTSTISSSSGSSSGTSVSNDFIVNTGTSGNTTITLSKDFAIGSYVIASSLGDTSYDVYLIATDGTLAGSVNSTTAQTTVDASKTFNKVVVYGTTNNDTLTFTFKYVFTPSADDSSITVVGPRITSLSTSTLANTNSTTTVTGKNFASNITATFTGTDNVVRNAKSVVRNSSTQLVITRPDDMPLAYNPYTLTLTNPGISNPTSTNLHKQGSLSGGSAPVWTTSAGEISTIFVKDSAYSSTLVASDPDAGGSITYSIVSGSLPTGISLNSSTGALTGTSSAAFGIYNFTVRATDAGGNYLDRAFSIANYISTDSDTFTRTTSGNLGNTSNKATVWTNNRGTWQADGSRAYSNDAASTHAIATVTAATTNITNLQVDTQNTGGVGLSFWVTDANSWYAVTTYYSTSSGTSTSCTGGTPTYAASCPTACNQCGGCDLNASRYLVYANCCDGTNLGQYTRSSCSVTTTVQNICTNSYGGYCGVSCDGPFTYYSCTTSGVTTSYTNYNSNFRLINNGSNLIDTQYNTNQSAHQTAGSIAVSTSGNTVSYSVYSAAGKTGTLYYSASTNVSSPTKGRNLGIYKGDGGTNQGSYVDNFSVTVS